MMKKLVLFFIASAVLLSGFGLAGSHEVGSSERSDRGVVQSTSYVCGTERDLKVKVLQSGLVEIFGRVYETQVPYREEDGMVCYKERLAAESNDSKECKVSVSWQLLKHFADGKLALGKKSYDCIVAR